MFVSLDLETTGFDPIKDKIIEFGAIKFDLQGNKETLQFLINPGIIIPQIITHITKITDADLKNAPKFEEKIEEIKNFIGDLPIIGHNIQFDTSFLKNKGIELTNLEYDTHQLASIFLPGFPSYSLEILSQIFGLEHKEKHRALDDAIAAMELFLALIKEIESLEPEFLEKIQKLSTKSNWDLKNLLVTLKPKKHPSLKDAKAEKENSETAQKSDYKKILETEKSALFEEIPPYDQLISDLAKHATPDTYISIPYQNFRDIEEKISNKVAKIDLVKNYISIKRLEQFSQKNHFENYEISALLKYLVWLRTTKTGLLSEVRIKDEEAKTLSLVNIDENIGNPHEEDFYKQALQKDQNSPAICTHQYILENPQTNSKLIIIDLENFLHTLQYKFSVYLKFDSLESILQSLPSNEDTENLKNKLVILFGLLGMIFEKENDNNKFFPRSTINEETLTSKDWLNAKDIIQNLIEISQNLGELKNTENLTVLQNWKKQLTTLHEVFFTDRSLKKLTWLEKNLKDEIILRSNAGTIAEEFQKFLQHFKNYKIIDENLDLADDCKFIKKISGIPEEIAFHPCPKISRNIEISHDLDNKNDESIANFFIEKFKNNTTGNTAIIFNGKQQLSFFTLKFSQAGLPLISQLTGSLGKLKEQLKEDKKNSLLVLNPHGWDSLENYNKISTLYIHKIPFDPPGIPELLALEKNFEDPFNELQVPRAVAKLKKMINRLPKGEIILLDSRLEEKEYGRKIMEFLK